MRREGFIEDTIEALRAGDEPEARKIIVPELKAARVALAEAGGRGVELAETIDRLDAALAILDGEATTCSNCGGTAEPVEPEARTERAALTLEDGALCRTCGPDEDGEVRS